MKKFLLFISFFLASTFLFGQTRLADSLVKSFHSEMLQPEGLSSDTNKINTLIEIIWQFRIEGNFKNALAYSDTALAIGNDRLLKTKIPAERKLVQHKIFAVKNNIGLIYKSQSDFPEALKLFFELLKQSEAAGDSGAVNGCYYNLGTIYTKQNNFDEALNYYGKSLAISKRNGFKNVTTIYGNLGVIYAQQNRFPLALQNFQLGLAESLKSGSPPEIAGAYNNLGGLYFEMGDYDKAIENFQLGLNIKEATGDKAILPPSYTNIAQVYTKRGNYKEAISFYLKAISIEREIHTLEWLPDAYSGLSANYEKIGDYPMALASYKSYIDVRDSIVNLNNTKKSLKLQAQYEFDKKAAADSVANAQARKVQEAELDAKNSQLKAEALQRYGLYIGLSLLLVFAVFIFNRFQVTQRQKGIIEKQKEIVEEKQKEIVDSINYAQRIQSAILPDLREIENLFSEAFVLFQPKDIVSGDFYWTATVGEYKFVVAADSTGHGVPGGFMSMLGSSLLNEIVIEKKIIEPGEILDMLRVKIILALKQKGDSGENKDGMDMVLCRYKGNELVFSAANNPLWYLRAGQMHEIKADKQPVGIFTGEQKMFTQHSLQLQKEDIVYIFTDGYADQFGGPKGKKFKYKQMQELMVENSKLPLQQQKVNLNSAFQSWKGELEQVDDVCIIGIKI